MPNSRKRVSRDRRKTPRRTRRSQRPPAAEPSDSGFARLLLDRCSPGEATLAGNVEPLAHLDYERELALKNEALQEFWQRHRLPGEPAAVQGSPLPRRYRTTTRRRASLVGGRLRLGFDAGDARSGALLPDSALEPQAHTAIYRFVLERISEPVNRPVTRHLNYLIVRGSYDSFSVIFNMDRLDGEIVRKLKGLGEKLESFTQPVVSAFVFHDPSRSDYYFEREVPPVPVRLKKLFGPTRFPLRFERLRYLLSPTSFSQINGSMVPPLLASVGELLQPSGTERLIDLFCGYGLFSHFLSPDCAEVYGVDSNRESIAAATASARYHPTRGKVAFFSRQITAASLTRILPAVAKMELAILDPPRQGTATEVMACLAARRPRRVVHIFCNTDGIPSAVCAWAAHAYRVTRCTPLDMFPGTPNLETVLLLEPEEETRRSLDH